MTRKLTLLTVVLVFAFSCGKDGLNLDDAATNHYPGLKPQTRDQINQQALRLLNEHQKFEWRMVDAQTVWSANLLGDSIMCIGYQPANEKNLNQRLHEIDIQQKEWKQVREALINYIVAETNRQNPGKTLTAKDLMPFGEESVLPVIDIKVSSLGIIEKLRSLPEVRYVEPMGYSYNDERQRSDSGCSVTGNASIPAADYTNITPAAKQSWHHGVPRISTAWGNNSGRGITVALLDTGTPNPTSQPKLGSQFNSGLSTGRTLTRTGTYVSCWFCGTPDGPNDQCGHGTQMAGLIAAPRGNDGTPAGVAYNCNLLGIRVTSDVIVNTSSEKKGLADGLVIAGNNTSVKIISMSIGDIFSSGQVEDGVRYAYGKGKMLLAAAGTSTSITNWYGVIFPAWMAECIAVTGVKDGGLPLERCNTCHSGSDVEFVAVMQRKVDNNRTALTLAPSGNVPANVGGSSAATATTAGIAALIWATNPAQTRAQVYARMKANATWPTTRSSEYGFGIIDAGKAVTGL
ncbi:S8 family peptidase [Haliscomenobacter hydrossis]|uniref:Peptidase S8 and S53 subtilisin kexin sedolisin n=1 Tax=Haliscomenobacter hydrossis (strain ATCC 27775 / DSM 1100 / LMG 10767 / O) TaxID=760192 RepID=F4KRK5_HALH1|nr:S8 family serine peptidase [Haliscomenobacter hydrossis]AEE48994.1 peptidase S8 and S53 subtilisin kexin sedolisin [Haliscomenobacter hydrossis DSM 1100]